MFRVNLNLSHDSTHSRINISANRRPDSDQRLASDQDPNADSRTVIDAGADIAVRAQFGSSGASAWHVRQYDLQRPGDSA
jgi:hypothetical protein